MGDVFLEVILDAAEFSKMSIQGRDEIEDPLSDALMNAGIGEVTGGGSGSGSVIFDIEIERDSNFDEALRIIRKVLLDLKSPRNTVIKRSKPTERIYSVYE